MPSTVPGPSSSRIPTIPTRKSAVWMCAPTASAARKSTRAMPMTISAPMSAPVLECAVRHLTARVLDGRLPLLCRLPAGQPALLQHGDPFGPRAAGRLLDRLPHLVGDVREVHEPAAGLLLVVRAHLVHALEPPLRGGFVGVVDRLLHDVADLRGQ